MKRLICIVLCLISCMTLFSCAPKEEPPEEKTKYESSYTKFIEKYSSPTEEDPGATIPRFNPHGFTMICPGFAPMSPEKFASRKHIVKVRYIGKEIEPRSYKKRAEYKFEVIDWIKGVNIEGQKEISIYSEVFDWEKFLDFDQSLAYFLEYSDYNCRYIPGEEYIVVLFGAGLPDLYEWDESVYIPLNNPSGTRMSYELISSWDEYKEANVGEMNAEEFEQFLRDIIEKYDPTEDGSSDSIEDNFGTDGEGASVE